MAGFLEKFTFKVKMFGRLAGSFEQKFESERKWEFRICQYEPRNEHIWIYCEHEQCIEDYYIWIQFLKKENFMLWGGTNLILFQIAQVKVLPMFILDVVSSTSESKNKLVSYTTFYFFWESDFWNILKKDPTS